MEIVLASSKSFPQDHQEPLSTQGVSKGTQSKLKSQEFYEVISNAVFCKRESVVES